MSDLDFLREATEVPADAVRQLRLRVLKEVGARRRGRRLAWFGIPASAAVLTAVVLLLAVRQEPAAPPLTRAMAPPPPPAAIIAAAKAPPRRPVPAVKPRPKAPVVMHIETADPDVVIYLVSSGGEE